MKIKRIASQIIAIVFFAGGCAFEKHSNKIRELVASVERKDYNSAVKIVEEKNFYPEQNSILVKKLEQGSAHYLAKNYRKALRYFDEAEAAAEELYTISIKSKIRGALDENLDNYSGEKYEISQIRFYKSLINYFLYKESDELSNLRSARSNILEWESLTTSYQNELAGKPAYKVDLLQKLWGGFIFEENGDDARAISSYKSAKNILFRNYNVYPSFNKNYASFRDNFSKLPQMSSKDVKEKFISNTKFADDLDAFLGKKIRQTRKDNLTVIIKDGTVARKKTKIVRVPLAIGAFADQSANFLNFLGAILIWSDNQTFFVEIELPDMEERRTIKSMTAEILDENGKKLADLPIVLVNPLSDIAFGEFEGQKTLLYARLTAKTLAKYVAAITASYAAYKNGIENNNPMLTFG
ncbi:MAG: hypothetical protein LBB09_01855, partial [Rickettsiales bacterium]|nr:hypothetical protein [Rickettsiales bacterium]